MRSSTDADDLDTLGDVGGNRTARRASLSRRGVLVAMTAVVGAGATGWLGLHTQRRSAGGSGYALDLTYPRVARAGMDITWQARVSRDRSFDPSAALVLAVTASYFDIFETQGFVPEPQDDTRDERWRYLEFSPQDDMDTLVVDFDTYVQPAAQIGRDAEIRLIIEDIQVAAIRWTTTLLP